ncbi:hypothetical protein FIM1_946 [Kluyveromyces marxianus]|uniref:Dolichol phosphate-mannose biosynthesis regulatory protein n=1 Tax=Kluyveromyces marxianus TaxID=4911 RepID=A0ABX6ERF3_KLUMA|nr:hypothetical protein FIM1_946 [Kluyveromyces marxianus]
MGLLWIVVGLFLYYCIWLLLPIFDLDQQFALFPLPSKYAVSIPIVLLLIATSIVGTSLAIVMWNAPEEKTE